VCCESIEKSSFFIIYQRHSSKSIISNLPKIDIECLKNARGGLALFAEFFEAMGVGPLVETYTFKPRSGRSFEAIRYIKPLCMSLYGGGESI